MPLAHKSKVLALTVPTVAIRGNPADPNNIDVRRNRLNTLIKGYTRQGLYVSLPLPPCPDRH